MEDIHLIGPPDDLKIAYFQLRECLEQAGLQLNKEKTRFYQPSEEAYDWTEGMERARGGVATLGATMATNSKYYEYLIEGEILRGIKELTSKQCAFLLLRYCANHQISHVTRMSPPSDTLVATSHDKGIEESLCHLLELKYLAPNVLQQIRLKTTRGGLGLISITGIRQPAFIASWSKSLSVLPLRVPQLVHIIQE